MDIDQFRAPEGKHIQLADWATDIEHLYDSKKDYHKTLEKQVEDVAEMQRMHYASNRYALLLIFQGMDAAGKDGAIRHVMSGINPQGCQVSSFKQPSTEELEHDFLWRCALRLPERGRIGVFNRSYYEDVLVVRVHPELLANQNLPSSVNRDTIWEDRYRSINGFEAHLHRNGTRIVKFFLHLSKDEQRDRFLARIDEPDKNWKFSLADARERTFWDDYMHAYGACISATSTRHAPWYIIPADNKKNARLLISNILLETFRSLDIAYPTVSDARREELREMRKEL